MNVKIESPEVLSNDLRHDIEASLRNDARLTGNLRVILDKLPTKGSIYDITPLHVEQDGIIIGGVVLRSYEAI